VIDIADLHLPPNIASANLPAFLFQQLAVLGGSRPMRPSMSNRYPSDEDTDAHLLKQQIPTHLHGPSSSAHHCYSQGITTLMIRNVPRRYTGAAILLELETFVEPGGYNFVYLPWDAHRSANNGYAFVNLISAQVAMKTSQKMNGACWHYVHSSKVITTMAAHLQGLEMNLVHYAGTHAVAQDDLHAPMVFANGSRIPFQEAVNQICRPKFVQKSEDVDSAYVDADETSTCSNFGDVKKMAMLSSSSSGTWSTSTVKNDFACDRRAVPIMLTHDPVNRNNQHLPQELAESDALQRGAKPFMAFCNKVTPECIQAAGESDVRKSPGYNDAWAKMNAQLEMLAGIHLKK